MDNQLSCSVTFAKFTYKNAQNIVEHATGAALSLIIIATG